MKSIVVVGAGFAGAYAARGILRRLPADYQLVLINPSPDFVFKPLIHELATGVFGKSVVTEPIGSFLRHKRFQFVQAAATKIDLQKQSVSVGRRSVGYDYLVLASGSGTNFFGVPGAEKFCCKLESVKDAALIKSALLSLRQNSRIVIIGGGPTGIELSAEVAVFASQLKKNASVTVIDISPRLLPQVSGRFRAKVQKYLLKHSISFLPGSGAAKISKNSVTTGKGSKLHADLIIWAAGIKPNLIAASQRIHQVEGYFAVDKYLRLKNCRNVFAAGDCAFVVNPDGKPVPALAQSAVAEGSAVAKNVLADINNQPLHEFVFRSKGFILTLGRGYAVADIKGFVFAGFFAWWLNRLAYLTAMMTFPHRFYVLMKWKIGFFRRRNAKKI